MKLLTIFELAAKPERALYHEAFNAAARADRISQEHRNALATLTNIRRVMSSRALRP